MKRHITGYHLDEENHWVAQLDCGHHQHVRHNPPWFNRPWVTSEQGRNEKLGAPLDCKKCDTGAPQDRAQVQQKHHENLFAPARQTHAQSARFQQPVGLE